jgi:hypothetical protein
MINGKLPFSKAREDTIDRFQLYAIYSSGVRAVNIKCIHYLVFVDCKQESYINYIHHRTYPILSNKMMDMFIVTVENSMLSKNGKRR